MTTCSYEPTTVIDVDGSERWYLNGRLHRDNGPALIHKDGTTCWYQHGLLHRDDGPAVIWTDGEEMWYQRDNLHRVDGPAIIYNDSQYRWYVNNDQYTNNASYQRAAGLTDEDMTALVLKYGKIYI